jgi:hypothetical protein
MPTPAKVITHELKIWPEFFEAWMDGKKRSEIRQDDRKFKVGDTVILREYEPKKKKYTGRAISMSILHITQLGKIPGIPKGADKFVMLSLASRKILRKSFPSKA